jgi:hypothetical protein
MSKSGAAEFEIAQLKTTDLEIRRSVFCVLLVNDKEILHSRNRKLLKKKLPQS